MRLFRDGDEEGDGAEGDADIEVEVGFD